MNEPNKRHATGMAGEFFVMERLFRRGHEPALTLGTAKSIDIIVRTKGGGLYTVSVKAVRSGGKWGVGHDDLSAREDLIFVFLHYETFNDVKSDPTVWVVPAADVQRMKRRWLGEAFAVFYKSQGSNQVDLSQYKDAWDYLDNDK